MAHRYGGLFCGVNMAVKISGVLKDGTGKPVQNCTIQLKAKRNSTTVVVNTLASENPDEAGRYSMDVEYGQYSVILLVEGFPPSHAGTITVYEDSQPGTLNDFLGAATEDDVRPEALRRFEQMVEEVARNAEAASQSAAAAKKSETAAASSKNAAKTSETNAANSAKAAASSKTAAQNAATAAERSETNARASEKASADSEEASRRNAESAAEDAGTAATKAAEAATSAVTAGKKKDEAVAAATRSEAAAGRAEAAAEVAAEPWANIVPPLPDVWIPFNDSLDMLTGFAPGYKTVTVGNDEVKMPSDKVVSFTRASSATYINKSGKLTVAAINEPRFEKEGLLIEGQRTNYLKNSNTPELWNYHSLLAKEYGVDNYGFNYATVTVTDSLVGTTSSYQIHSVTGENRFSLSIGETCTFSARFRGVNSRCRVHISLVIGENVKTSVDVCLEPDTGEVKAYGNKALVTFRTEKQGDWCYFETTYTAAENIDEVVCGFFITNPEDGGFSSDSSLTMTTPQIEKGPCASSFIVSGNTPATRASDMVNIPITNNLSYIPVSCLVEVSRGWDIAPSSAPRIMHTIGVADNSEQLILAFRSPQDLSLESLPYAQIGVAQAYVPVALKTGRHMVAGFSCGADGKFKCVVNGNLSTQSTSSWTGTGAATQIRFGGSSAGGERHLFGHVRNLRIWHKELNDRQLKEAV